MATKKKPAKKKAEPKSKAKAADVIDRVHGATVFTKRGVSEETAKALVADHGFRLTLRTDDGHSLTADMTAYQSYKAAK